MKTKEFKDLKNKDAKALIKLLAEKKVAISKGEAEMYAGREKNLKVVRNLRREVAKILTLIKEKEIMEKLTGTKKEVTK